MAEVLKDVDIQKKSVNTTVKGGEALKGKMVAFYFASHFHPKCREFTPVLKDFYEEVAGAGEDFEVVFFSYDRSADNLAKHMAEDHGDWYYLPFGSEAIYEVASKFGAGAPPKLMVFKADGSLVSKNACRQLRGNPPKVTFSQWKEAAPMDLHNDDPITTPEQAVEALKSISDKDLSAEEEETLLSAVKRMDLGNYLLMVKVNPAWVAEHGQQMADAILDFVATWGRSDGSRRDASPDAAHHFLFKFSRLGELAECREELLKNEDLCRACVVLSPFQQANIADHMVKEYGPALGPLLGSFVDALPKQPMAEVCCFVSKQGSAEYDFSEYDFFS